MTWAASPLLWRNVCSCLRKDSASIARLGRPSTEQSFEASVREALERRSFMVQAQVRSKSSADRYDLVCHAPADEPFTGSVLLELKMRLDASHYKQFDRYLRSDPRQLVAVGWQASAPARRTLRELADEFPDRFAVVVISDGASLA